jgi:alpha-beta hydrolase superfamily lysophospholipase
MAAAKIPIGQDPRARAAAQAERIEWLRERDMLGPEITSLTGEKLRSCKVTDSSRKPLGVVFYLHGYDHHGSDYNIMAFAQNLCSKGFDFYAMDFRGHGISEGVPALIDKNVFILDELKFISTVCADCPEVPFFISGESMGGALALRTAMVIQNEGRLGDSSIEIPANPFLGCIALCPAIHNSVEPSAPVTWMIRFILRPLAPMLRAPGVTPLLPEMISGSPSRQQSIIEDPFTDGRAFFIASAEALLTLTWDVIADIPKVKFPFVVVHGHKDQVIPISGSKQLLADSLTCSEDKLLIEIPDGDHDVLTNMLEPWGEFGAKCYVQLLDWIENRVVKSRGPFES